MTLDPNQSSLVAIACGGTGGHLFPGVAVAEELMKRGVDVNLLVSSKAVDRLATRALTGMEIISLPVIGSRQGGRLTFLLSLVRAVRASRQRFRACPPSVLLSMGGFVGMPPVVAAVTCRIPVFLHEANAVPGRANRWCARFAREVFLGFEQAGESWSIRRRTATGTPVRDGFADAASGPARQKLGLKPDQPVLLVMGGSQGATAINRLVINGLAELSRIRPELQYLHLTGTTEATLVREAYERRGIPAVVQPFLEDMSAALGAATLAISRSGASSLAEFAALRVPAVLIPYPHALGDHQTINATILSRIGAAIQLDEAQAKAGTLVQIIDDVLRDDAKRSAMKRALARCHRPDAALRMVDRICATVPALRRYATRDKVRLPNSSQQGSALNSLGFQPPT